MNWLAFTPKPSQTLMMLALPYSPLGGGAWYSGLHHCFPLRNPSFKSCHHQICISPFQPSAWFINSDWSVLSSSIVFVWSQYDGGNIDKEQLAKVPSKT